MDSLEKLLLLEFLVDNVYYEKAAIDSKGLKDTNVKFKFLDFPSINIGEADFCLTNEKFDNSEVTFKSGKSILFALPDTTAAMRQTFDIFVTISRNKDENGKVEIQELGHTIIHLGDSFINLLEATSYDGTCPTSRTIRDSFQFSDRSGNVIGYVTIFVRLSCFGKMIITQFQADSLNDKSFCFKGGKDEAVPVGSPVEEISQYQSAYGGGESSMMTMPPPMQIGGSFMPPYAGGHMPPYGGGQMPPMHQTINVPLKKREVSNKCGRVPSELLSTDSEGNKGPCCMLKDCPQGYPRPSWLKPGRRGGGGVISSNRKTSGLPVGSTAFQGDDILFQMSNPFLPTSRANKQNTVFHVNNEPDQPKQNVQMVEPECKPEVDFDNDVFLLTFGKRDRDNKPAKLVVTMKTPKVPILNEHKCTSERHSQTDPSITRPKVSPVLSPLQSAAASNLTTTEIAAALGKVAGNRRATKTKDG